MLKGSGWDESKCCNIIAVNIYDMVVFEDLFLDIEIQRSLLQQKLQKSVKQSTQSIVIITKVLQTRSNSLRTIPSNE